MKILLDTSTVIRGINTADAKHALVLGYLNALLDQQHELVLASQVVYECWVVCTRPQSSNGLGMSPSDAASHVESVMIRFPPLSDPPDLLERWLTLCRQFEVSGRTAHDARLVSWMTALRVPSIVTLNPRDFLRFPGIQVLVRHD